MPHRPAAIVLVAALAGLACRAPSPAGTHPGRAPDTDAPLDACEGVDCSGTGSCVSEGGAASCICDQGYASVGLACSDIDECALGTHDCVDEASCTNTEGGYECGCALTGYIAGGDGDGCVRMPAVLVAIPDTQLYVQSVDAFSGFAAKVQWIVDHAEERNIRFVTQLGDIVSEADDAGQWARAEAAMSALDQAGIPWGTAVGNHELDPAPPPPYLVDAPLDAEYDRWRSHFGAQTTGRFDTMEGFGGASGAAPSDEIYDLDTFHTFEDGGRTYLILHLEHDVPDRSIAWAQGVLDDHPGLPAIVSTHVYLGSRHGPPTSPFISGPGRNGQPEIWDELIRVNPQIFLVLSAHTGEEMERVRYNDAGLPVIELAADYTGRDGGVGGWMRLIELDELSGEVRATAFAPGFPSYPSERSDLTDVFYLDWPTRFDGAATVPGDLVIDDFEIDSTREYAPGDAALGASRIEDGVLHVSANSDEPFAVMRAVADVEPGSEWGVDLLDESGVGLVVSTAPAPPDGSTSAGFVVERDGGTLAVVRYGSMDGGEVVATEADPGGDLTLWIARNGVAEWTFHYEQGGERTSIGSTVLDPVRQTRPMHVGVQASSEADATFDLLRRRDAPAAGTSVVEGFSATDPASLVLSQSYGSGGTLELTGGELVLQTGADNTVSAVLDDGISFVEVGSRWGVDVLDPGNAFLMVTSDTEEPSGTSSFGVRLRRDTAGYRVGAYTEGGSTISDFVTEPGGPVTLWLERLSETSFATWFETDRADRVFVRTVHVPEVWGVTRLRIGLQAYSQTAGARIGFDNLRTGMVEPLGTDLFRDRFGADTSADYVGSDSYGAGGSFSITGGSLRLTHAASNTYTVVPAEAHLGVGTGCALRVSEGSESFLLVSTVAAQPELPGEHGIRLRGDTTFAIAPYVDGQPQATLQSPHRPPSGATVLYVDRATADTFRFFFGRPGSHRVHLGDVGVPELAGEAWLHCGAQHFATAAGTTEVDDLRTYLIDVAQP